MNLNNTLDTLIAVVIVLLILSLIVQSVQEAIKKFLKLKSLQIEDSLVDLFETVIHEPMANPSATKGKENLFQSLLKAPAFQALPQRLKSWIGVRHPAERVTSERGSEAVELVFRAVMKEFQDIGRVAISKEQMLNSISKEDLMKVLRRIGVGRLLPGFAREFETACIEFKKISAALEAAVAIVPTLPGDAGIEFAQLRDTLAPLFNDSRVFFKEDGSFNQDLLLADVLNLRDIKLDGLLALLGSVQRKVNAELTASPAPNDVRQAELKNARETLGQIAQNLTGMSQKLDAALVPLQLKLGEVGNWYDTVMQSFEERYARGMKTVAFIISLLVAVTLNANIFGVYNDVASNPQKRAAILAKSDEAMAPFKQQEDKKIQDEVRKANDAANDSTKSDEEKKNAEKYAKDQIRKILEDTKTEMDKNAAIYGGFGFTPLKADWAALWIGGVGAFFRQMLYMLVGWVLMGALLSVGAPFWNDTLQSLFGVKNLLQKKGEIKNTEQKSGEGQPKS